MEEVKAYCAERKNGIDPQAFVNHYQTNNWMRGKTKIKDWKACVKTWEANSNSEAAKGDKPGVAQSHKAWTPEDRKSVV